MASPSVCIIGAGNVASHLAAALARSCRIVTIAAKHSASAAALAGRLADLGFPDIPHTSQLDKLPSDADFYLIAVNDDAITSVIDSTPDYPGIWAHTSGSIDMEVFHNKKSHYGVFYPLQTFTRDLSLDVNRIPFFIEGNSESTAQTLSLLASSISQSVTRTNSDMRRRLHIAAVFACNFANLMWAEADALLSEDNLSIKFLMPLLEQTLLKLNSISPREAMTGPARRGDTRVIESHIANLDPVQADIYRQLSSRIMSLYNINNHSDSSL